MNKEKLIEWIKETIEKDKESMKYNRINGDEYTYGQGTLFGASNILELLLLGIEKGEFDVD